MIFQLILAELKSFYRNPGILFWTFGFPILLVLILGMAFTKKQDTIKKISITNPLVNEYIKKKTNDASLQGLYSQFIFSEDSEQSAIVKMKRGEISLYLSYENNSILYHFDPNNTESFLNYLLLKEVFQNKNQEKSGEDIRILSSKGTRYIDFLLPGLLAMGIMNSCLWGTAWILIEFRIKKLLRRLMSTPLSKSTFLFSHILIRFLLSGVEFVFLSIFGYFLFDVEIQGSLSALFLVFFSGNLAFTGLAILLSSRASNNQIANGLINLTTMPMMICSGIFFSYHSFPESLEKIVSFFPLTMLTDSIRVIFIEGAGYSEIWINSLILSALGIFFFMIGLKIYKWD